MIERFDHVSIGVRDIKAALPLVRLLGGELFDGGDSVDARFRWVQFTLPGGGKLELIAPLPGAAADHFLVRFLESRGEGVHHLTLKVSDIGRAIEQARDLGFTLVAIDLSHEHWKEAFVHPRSASGVLVQLAAWDDTPRDREVTLGAILEGVPDRYA